MKNTGKAAVYIQKISKSLGAVFKKNKVIPDNRGMALLIAIVTLVLLVAVTLQFHRNTWAGYRAAYAVQIGGKLEAIASSGLNMALAALRADAAENEFDSLLDRWAILSGDEMLETMFPDGTLDLQVFDLSGRFPLNGLTQLGAGEENGEDEADTEGEAESAAEEDTTDETAEQQTGDQEGEGSDEDALADIMLRLLTSGNFAVADEAEARELVDALKDWIDEDDEESEYGAESSYYSSAELGYACRNADLQSVEELLLIRGFTKELLFGTDEKKALADFVAVESDEWKINLNTAPKEVLMSLDPLITEELADRLIEFRADQDNREQLSDPSWYLNVGGWPGDIVFSPKMLTAKGTYFRVEATGVRDNFRKKLTAVVERANLDQLRLIWKKQE